MRKSIAFAMLVLSLSLALTAAGQTEVTFCAPAGTREAMAQIFSEFESKTGYKVKPTFGVGADLKKRVANGEAFDLSVFQAPYPEVLNSGNVIESSAKTLASELVGVAVKKGAPTPDISTPEAVKKALLSAKSIAAGGGVVNTSLDETLKKLGISDQVQPKLKRSRSSAEVMQMVASGEVEFGITLLNEMEVPGIDIVAPLPREISPPFILVGFISTHAQNPKATMRLLDYLASPEAARVYMEHHLMIPGR